MQPPKQPKITAVQVVAAQPTDAEKAAIARLSAESDTSLPEVAYVVKVKLETKPPVTSIAWALYVGDTLIPKYWEYPEGIYFTVLDSQFFDDHNGQSLRFSLDGIHFHNTRKKLTAPTAATVLSKSTGRTATARRLPPQADVLHGEPDRSSR